MSLVDFILPVFVLLGLFWSISKLDFFKNGPFSTRSLQLAFFLRIVMGFGLFLIYSYHYPSRQDADTFKYFDDSKYMYDAFWTNPGDYFKMLFGIHCNTEYFNTAYFDNMSNWVRSYDNGLFNDNRLMIRVNAFLRIFSFGNYHVHSIILAFLAFMGSFSLSRLFFEVSRSKVLTYIAVFLVPSLVFWSSGILKESVLLAALGFFAYHFYQLFDSNRTWKNYVMLFLMSCVLIVLKLYVFMAFVPAIIIWLVVSKWRRSLWVYLLMYIFFIAIATLLGEINPRYDFVNLIVDKQRQFIRLADFYPVNSRFDLEVLNYEFWSLLLSSPEAMFNVFTKPWPNELNSILYIPSFIENAVIILLLVTTFVYGKALKVKEWDFVIFCLSFCIILYAVIGLTTPITGAIVRYKIPAIPFLMMAVFMLIDFDKIPIKFTQNKLSRWINTFL
ncbi:MAG: hypothetical protein ISP70_03775 [Crocinitomicaceae bacterium]|nr:hypothetical protein [Crocinitomicaceae bacterium]